jgi:SAM-dependent methyltransferase
MTIPLIYDELAPWFHLLTPPEHYVDDAAQVLELLRANVSGRIETLLELGSGGGNTASHLRRDLRVTLADLSPPMLEISRTINPNTEHIVGDMRTLRLGRQFDAVLIHDAICYMTTVTDLRAAMSTAHEHLRPGGVAILVPDHVAETFRPATDHGGVDAPPGPDGRPGRALRYLEWTTDPDPSDTTYEVDYALLVREADGSVQVHHDRHVEGLFAHQLWLDQLGFVGFEASSASDAYGRFLFVGRRPTGVG